MLLCALSVCSLLALTVAADETTAPIETGLKLIQSNIGRNVYNVGEMFDTTGYIGKITYPDGTTKAFAYVHLKVVDPHPLTIYDKTVTIECEGFTATVPITVNNNGAPIPEIISIDAEISKTSLLEPDKIDSSMLTVKAMRADGSVIDINPQDCAIFPELGTTMEAGSNIITVTYSYNGRTFTDAILVEVAAIRSLEVSGTENALLYEALPIGAPAGLTVTAYYDDAKLISRVLTDYDISSDSPYVTANANGKAEITIEAGSVSIPVEIPVAKIVSYKVTGLKKAYYYGETIDLSAVTVEAVYSDMTIANVTADVKFPPAEVIRFGSTFTATHNGFDLKDYIGNILPEGKIVVITPPSKLKYEIGEIFDSAGLTVAIEYADGVKNFLTPADYSLVASLPLTAADKVVKIEYFGATESITISVGHEAYITSIKILGVPDILNYFEGNFISTSGLIIEAYMSDGTTAIIDPKTLTFTPSLTTPLTPDITSVIISANDGTDKECSALLPITVQAKLPTALVATTRPYKLTYKEGEIFDPDGLALSLFFNDQTSIVPSSFTFSPALGTPIVLEKNAESRMIIYAVYDYNGTEFTYPIEITVTPAEVENLLVSRHPAKTVYEIGESFDPTGIELLLIYKEVTLMPQRVPEGYFTFSPAVIEADTDKIVFEFRGLTVECPITVNGGTTTPADTTDPITPPDTTPEETTTPDTPPEQTTEPVPPETSDPAGTTAPEDPTTAPEQSSSPENPDTTEPDETTDAGSEGPTSLLGLWIIIIAIIIAMLIALIIYYKRNFT